MSLAAHIAVNAVFLGPRMGGHETIVRQLLPELRTALPDTRLSVFVGPRSREVLAAEPWSEDVAIETHPLLGRPGGRAASELTLLGTLAARRNVDVLYSIAMTGPLHTRVAHVVNVADTTWISHPDPGDMAMTMRLWRLIVPRVARSADRVIAISQAGRDDVVRRLGVPADLVDVTYLGAGSEPVATPTPEAELRSRLSLGTGPVVLSVSAKKPHKNLVRLVRAMGDVARRVPDAMLVLPGSPTTHEQELRAEAKRLGLETSVRFPDWVSDSDLEGLYRIAACSVVASLNEGFGLPVLDSMRRGIAVACSNTSALPEVAGTAARYFDPLDERQISGAILELLDDESLRSRLVAAGRTQAATFTWKRCAEETIVSLDRAWTESRR